ncbi:cAMP-binding domain of CRP or a regulatory subunit of cAMP-dependent protein kinases [Chryseobacterium taeanense]|uniref:cAMP-binding domain of CRP or a regulatory subunit of cAMP-dependent protein kinases n=1 Tax=Chryseobacterium taeanense TaxID=311334 RepID=A0A1G8LEJ2_9FLAO|nr:Crp/Fnr family transcriptional regulator [Chryseobacterium taeanense]SDI53650.1 cAMP-binding domain of CRP or a regulatory subunit of cAMP-dependent protein kinases [Chryseobacterium taeanense]
MIRPTDPKPSDFFQFVEHHCRLDEKAGIALHSKIREQAYKKGDILVEEGKICNKIYFLNIGLVKTLLTTDSREFTMRFFSEGNVFSVLDSFIQQKPSVCDIVALEDSTVSYILHNDLQTLCQEYHQIETFYRKLLSMAVIEMMSRVGHSLEETGVVAYNRFLKDQGHLLQRISLADLASYLGITQVSLSRIRRIK